MMDRCYKSRSDNYKWYGGAGVIVCDEWKTDFIAFYRWAISNGWEKGLQLDKDIKGSGKIYSPDTCMFVTGDENMRKRTDSNIIEYNGEKRIITDWAKLLGMSDVALGKRIKKWGIIRAMEQPVDLSKLGRLGKKKSPAKLIARDNP
jgi:hypothetical protein